MTRDEILSLCARRQEAWRRRDAAALAADHTEDCTLTSPMAGIVSGRGTIENVYDVWFTGFPDFMLKDEELVVDEDRVVQISIISGTDTGRFMGLPPSGRAFRIPTVHSTSCATARSAGGGPSMTSLASSSKSAC